MFTMNIEDIKFSECPVWFVGGAEGRPSYYAPLQPYDEVLSHKNFKITGTLNNAVELIQSGLDKIEGLTATFSASESLWMLTFMNGFTHMEGTVRLYRTFTQQDGYTHIVEFKRFCGDFWKSQEINDTIRQLFYPVEETVNKKEECLSQEASIMEWEKKYATLDSEPHQEYILPTMDDIKQVCIEVLQHGRYNAVIDTFSTVASFYCEEELLVLTDLDKKLIQELLKFIETPPFESEWPERYSIHILANMSRSKEYCLEIIRAYEAMSKSPEFGLEELLESILIADDAPLAQTEVKIWELLQNIDLHGKEESI